MSNRKYNVLMFGNYGPELVKLSSLFDPDTSEFVYQDTNIAAAGVEYYYAELKSKTLRFFKLDPQPELGSELPDNHRWYRRSNTTLDDDETGEYVPAKDSLVIVDQDASDNGYGKWETFTLLVVESVDPVTFRSTLRPVNFTGTLDSYTRAIDFQNDRMMLYMDRIGDNQVRLTPDRKLLLYSSSPLSYLIRKNDVVISTAELSSTSLYDAESYTRYVSAVAAEFGPVTNENKSELLGKYIEYYDTDHRVRCIVDESRYQSILGKIVYVLRDSESTLNGLQIPQSCYLRRQIELSEGDNVIFEAYEQKETTTGGNTVYVNRLIMQVQLTVTAGMSTTQTDSSAALITGFGVKYNVSGDNYSHKDIIEVPRGTSKADILAKLHPYLLKDDGSVENIDHNLLDRMWFVYGLEDYDPQAAVGFSYPILVRYFPHRSQEINNSINSLDLRYEKLTAEELAAGPSPIRQYFIRNQDETYSMASSNGYIDAFVAGTNYYKRRTNLWWGDAVHAPMRDFVNCHKVIKVVESASTSLRYPVLVPHWGRWSDDDIGEFQFGMLLYTDYSSPSMVALSDEHIASLTYDGESSDNGLHLNGKTISAGGPVAEFSTELAARQFIGFKYRSNAASEFDSTTHEVGVRLRTPSILTSGARKWVIDVDGNTYGSTATSLPDPYIVFDYTDNVYRFPSSLFTTKEIFLRTFYYSMFGSDAPEPTHIKLRGLDASVVAGTSTGTHLVPLDADNGSQFTLPFLVDFIKPSEGMMPTRYEDAIKDQSTHVIPNGAVVGVVILEFCDENEHALGGVPVEVRIVNHHA